MDIEKFYENLGKRIKTFRKKAGLTQEQLAEKTGLSLDFIGKIEINLKHPSIPTLLILSDTFNIHIRLIKRHLVN